LEKQVLSINLHIINLVQIAFLQLVLNLFQKQLNKPKKFIILIKFELLIFKQ